MALFFAVHIKINNTCNACPFICIVFDSYIINTKKTPQINQEDPIAAPLSVNVITV